MTPPPHRLLGRRDFLKSAAAAAGGLGLAGCVSTGPATRGIPRRVLGRTGLEITTLGLGSASIGHSKPGAAAGVPVYRAALEAGINYVDTAYYYDDAQLYLGEVIPAWRDRIVLATKMRAGGNDTAARRASCEKQFEESLRLLRTDHVDILHLHSVGDADPEALMAKGGPLDYALQMKERGRTRFIGITGHNRPARFLPLLETGQIDVVMVALNFVDLHTYGFENAVLPVARKHRCGLLAMKVFGGPLKGFGGYRQVGPPRMPAEWIPDAFRYTLSLEGVAANIIGVYNQQQIDQCVDWAKNFTAFPPRELDALRARGRDAAPEWGSRFGPAA